MHSVKLCGNNTEKVINAEISQLSNGDFRFWVRADNIGEGWEYADVFYDAFKAVDSDVGYYVIPDLAGGRLVRFKETEGTGSYVSEKNALRMIGCVINGAGYVGKITGMSEEYKLVCSKQDGEYRYFLRFPLEGRKPYEDIEIIIHKSCDDSFDYNSMARWYREKGFESGEITPLKEKVKNNPIVKYAAESVNIRIRMAWKPAPSKVMEQTCENEPELHVACTFSMVEDLIDQLKNQGVEKADICLVGWNVSGHDGRWPEMFPVEPKLGGEEGLKRVLTKAEKAGYVINLHTNFTDAYSIAENFSEDFIIKRADGSLSANFPWSGGRMYDVAVKYCDGSYIEDLKKIGELGIKGLHYVDVISAVPPRRSYDPKFPMNPKEYINSSKEILRNISDIFGGVSSESGMDHVIDCLDFILYAQFPGLWNKQEYNNWMDEEIPLWFIVYHGSVLYNVDTKSINHIMKGKEKALRMIELAARPVAYCFVDFIEGIPNWGKEDLVWTADEKPVEIAKIIALTDEHYKDYKQLQYSLIKSQRYISEGVSEICYEDGTVLTVDYNKEEYFIKKCGK